MNRCKNIMKSGRKKVNTIRKKINSEPVYKEKYL